MAYLVLSNGMAFEGRRIGAEKEALGELVFTTGSADCIETVSDPAFFGQIVIQTFPLIGNCGAIKEDLQGKCALSGYIVREICDFPTNFRQGETFDSFLKAQGVPGLAGVDTRELTRVLRENGAMNAIITDTIPNDLSPVWAYAVKDAVKSVSSAEINIFPAPDEKKFSVTLLDLGVKNSLIKALNQNGCEVTLVPYDTTAADILKAAPDGVIISEGPGDPSENSAVINEIEKLMGKVPLLGIGLGHQLIALSAGFDTEKLKCGHRGANHPVTDIQKNRTYITVQNHGYAVLEESVSGAGNVFLKNLNDDTVEGIEYPGKQCFTLQFMPDTATGPYSTRYLFDRFISMMEGA